MIWNDSSGDSVAYLQFMIFKKRIYYKKNEKNHLLKIIFILKPYGYSFEKIFQLFHGNAFTPIRSQIETYARSNTAS